MKTLFRPAATKGIDQEAMSTAGLGYPFRSVYVPLENHQSWSASGLESTQGLSIITAYQCVRILANTFASIPTLLYRRLPGGGRERADSHPLYRTFSVAANPDMSAF